MKRGVGREEKGLSGERKRDIGYEEGEMEGERERQREGGRRRDEEVKRGVGGVINCIAKC